MSDDLISRNKLFKDLNDKNIKVVASINEVIMNQPIVNQWIAVKNRLPEKNKAVLCWVKSTTIQGGETSIIGSCNNGFWFFQVNDIGIHSFPVKDYEVVAWMPLPKSYREEGKIDD